MLLNIYQVVIQIIDVNKIPFNMGENTTIRQNIVALSITCIFDFPYFSWKKDILFAFSFVSNVEKIFMIYIARWK